MLRIDNGHLSVVEVPLSITTKTLETIKRIRLAQSMTVKTIKAQVDAVAMLVATNHQLKRK